MAPVGSLPPPPYAEGIVGTAVAGVSGIGADVGGGPPAVDARWAAWWFNPLALIKSAALTAMSTRPARPPAIS
jgi:hypothetical protein